MIVVVCWPGGFWNVSLNFLSSVDEVGLWFRFHNGGRLSSEAEHSHGVAQGAVGLGALFSLLLPKHMYFCFLNGNVV